MCYIPIMIESRIKINFISGLAAIVTDEIAHHQNISIVQTLEDFMYLDRNSDISSVLKLQSITHVFLIKRDKKIHPTYINNHKSILTEMVEEVLGLHKNKMKTFWLSCAGNQSDEIVSIKTYIKDQYKLVEDEGNPDLKLYIGKNDDIWELGVEMTPRPLSSRDYKVGHIGGGMNPTVAYAMNSLCSLSKAQSYLNVFSGSATLLIESATLYPDIKYLGFDNNKDHISTAIQNLRQAKLLQSIQIKFLDIFDGPDLGMFDIITSDLPFGMNIAKGENLEKLYREFIIFCERSLNTTGTLAIYTTEFELLEPLLKNSKFTITKSVPLKIFTNANAYIYPKIFICKFA